MAQFSATWCKQLSDRMALLRVSQATIASIVGLPQNKIGAFFAGLRGLENSELIRIYDFLMACEKIAELAAPLAIDWRQTAALKESFEMFKHGELRSVVRAAEA